MRIRKGSSFVLIALLMSLVLVSVTNAQGPAPRAPRSVFGTAFTYQGSLKNASGPVSGSCSLQFDLWDAVSSGNHIAGPVNGNPNPVTVTGGLFTVQVDFGAGAFDGNARFLQIGAKCGNEASYAPLSPRQELTAAPYALFAANANQASTAAMATNFSGSLAGDVTGTQGSTTVTKLQGRTVASTAPTTGQVLKWDGSQWSPGADGVSYQNVVIVAKSGGNYTSIQAALDSISGAGDTNRYLVKVMPGTYSEKVTMKEFVDIEGSGEFVTKITSGGSTSGNTGTVVGKSNAELRFLTVENTGGNSFAIAVYTVAAPRLTHIIATASGGTTTNIGVHNGWSASPAMLHLTAAASGGATSRAISNERATPTMMNVIATASDGSSENTGIYNSESSFTMTDVAAMASGGPSTNYGVANWLSSSPTMMNVTATAEGGGPNYGVYNSSSSPKMTNVTATGSGGIGNFGVRNVSSSPTMTNVAATASGGNAHGVRNDASSPIIQSSVLQASGTGTNYGILNAAPSGAFTVTVNNSRVVGRKATISNDAAFTTRVGASQLDGGAVTGGGTFTCVSSYNASYVALGTNCQ